MLSGVRTGPISLCTRFSGLSTHCWAVSGARLRWHSSREYQCRKRTGPLALPPAHLGGWLGKLIVRSPTEAVIEPAEADHAACPSLSVSPTTQYEGPGAGHQNVCSPDSCSGTSAEFYPSIGCTALTLLQGTIEWPCEVLHLDHWLSDERRRLT